MLTDHGIVIMTHDMKMIFTLPALCEVKKVMQTFSGIPPQTDTFLEWANILHDEIVGVEWYSFKRQGIFIIRISDSFLPITISL